MAQELASLYDEIAATVRERLKGAVERPWTAIEPDTDAYSRLLESIVARVNWEGDQLPLSVATCLVLLNVRPFTDDTIRELVQVVENALPKEQRVRRAIEVAVAYYCDAWPHPRDGETPAPVAVAWFAATVRINVVKSFRWLRGRVTNLWEILGTDKEHFFDMCADHIAWRLMKGACDCLKLTEKENYRLNKKNVEEMSRRHLRDHFLSSWNPEQQYLWDFLANAVRGRGGLKPGSIRQGMVYSTFQEELGIRVANLPRKYCIHVGRFYANHDVYCPYCRIPHPASETPIEIALEIVLTRVPAGPDGKLPYKVETAKWWRCKRCSKTEELTRGELTEHYFADVPDPARRGICPLCGANQRGRGKSCADAYVRFPIAPTEGEESPKEKQPLAPEVAVTPVPGLSSELRDLVRGLDLSSDARVWAAEGERTGIWTLAKPAADERRFHLSVHFYPLQSDRYQTERVTTAGILAARDAVGGATPYRAPSGVVSLALVEGGDNLLREFANDSRRPEAIRAMARRVLSQREAPIVQEASLAGQAFIFRWGNGRWVFPATAGFWGHIEFRDLPRNEGPYRLDILGRGGYNAKILQPWQAAAFSAESAETAHETAASAHGDFICRLSPRDRNHTDLSFEAVAPHPSEIVWMRYDLCEEPSHLLLYRGLCPLGEGKPQGKCAIPSANVPHRLMFDTVEPEEISAEDASWVTQNYQSADKATQLVWREWARQRRSEASRYPAFASVFRAIESSRS